MDAPSPSQSNDSAPATDRSPSPTAAPSSHRALPWSLADTFGRNQFPAHARAVPERSPGAGLSEFSSLLEAAERIAASAAWGDASGQWVDDSQPDPIIRRSTRVGELRRRVPLTRQYSGRPHVPGEDSGSEEEDEEDDVNMDRDERDEVPDLRALAAEADGAHGVMRSPRGDDSANEITPEDFVSENLRRMNDSRIYMEAARERERLQLPAQSESSADEQGTESDRSATVPDVVNGDPHHSADPSEQAQASLRRAASLTRELRRHQMNRRHLVAAVEEISRHEQSAADMYADTVQGSSRETIYDWVSDARNIPAEPGSRTRSTSVRRWRPSERLQDFASNHARRESGDESRPHDGPEAQINAQGAGGVGALYRNSEGELRRIGAGRVHHARPETPVGASDDSELPPSTQWRTDPREDPMGLGIRRTQHVNTTDAQRDPLGLRNPNTVAIDLSNVRRRDRPENVQADPIGRTWGNANVQSSSRSTAQNADQRDSGDIVGRLDSAIQEYRLASRAFRAGSGLTVNQTAAANARSNDGSATSSASTPRDRYEARWNLRAGDRSTAGSRQINDSPSPDSREGSALSPTSRWRRTDDTVRQRTREQYRERRQRGIATMLDQEVVEPLASGPLFDTRSSTGQSEEEQAAQWRRLIMRRREQARRAENRANNKDLKQARASMKYLSRLREVGMTSVTAWTLAAELGIHNQDLLDSSKDRLPLSIDDLPEPAFCSWLEPGMTWSGIQCADQVRQQVPVDREEPDRENWRRLREQSDLLAMSLRQNESFRARMRQSMDPLERAINGSTSSRESLAMAQESMSILEDAERDLSAMVERSQALIRENEEGLRRNRAHLRETDDRLRRLQNGLSNQTEVRGHREDDHKNRDNWNVKVTLHSIDWKKMTLAGTMTACQREEPRPGRKHDPPVFDSNAMDSFFTGEIIDFATHGLDTPSSAERDTSTHSSLASESKLQDGWKVGGAETDLLYWAGVGPFKREIDNVIRIRETELLMDHSKQALDQNQPNSTAETQDQDKPEDLEESSSQTIEPPPSLSDDDKQDLKLRTMHQLLCDTIWLNQHINAEGWILMRWKERCFVSPGTGPNPEPTRPWIPNLPTDNTWDLYNDLVNLGISDPARLRYAGLNRRTQEAQRRNNTTIYTTNAQERAEVSRTPIPDSNTNSTNEPARPSRQPTWGLTISGFYYVALHRQTGKVEALYYDCGSAPFQRLKMEPVVSNQQLQRWTRANVKQAKAALLEGRELDGGDMIKVIDGSLRTNFGVVEFR